MLQNETFLQVFKHHELFTISEKKLKLVLPFSLLFFWRKHSRCNCFFFYALIDGRCRFSMLQVRRENVLYSFPKGRINVFE